MVYRINYIIIIVDVYMAIFRHDNNYNLGIFNYSHVYKISDSVFIVMNKNE